MRWTSGVCRRGTTAAYIASSQDERIGGASSTADNGLHRQTDPPTQAASGVPQGLGGVGPGYAVDISEALLGEHVGNIEVEGDRVKPGDISHRAKQKRRLQKMDTYDC